ncbi:MAG: 3-phosphoshikimate 1-carboxyvinyltransferase [Rhodothermales bacterium]
MRRTNGVAGSVDLPPDKSIAHRSALFAAMGEGTSTVMNYPASADPQSTLSCLRRLGIEIAEEDDALVVHGRGLGGFRAPDEPIDCGNSGTTMRLLAGMLAGRPFDSELVGDEFLNGRPMERIALPLREMGARIHLTSGHAPIRIEGGSELHGITYRLPIPSAQVKSCVLLAGLFAEGRTTVIEELPSRDHTERMLGLAVIEKNGERHILAEKDIAIEPRTWTVPRDFSAAAFFLVAGAAAPEGELHLPRVGLNPTRNALLHVLQAMGARIEVSNETNRGGEPIGDLTVRASDLQGVRVDGELIPVLIDEVPILAVAGALAEGRTEIRDAKELRVKETDRIRAMVDNLRRMGASVEEFEDGLAVEGPAALEGAVVDSFHDHRIAMAMGVAGLMADGETVVEHASCAAVSFPDFWRTLDDVAL